MLWFKCEKCEELEKSIKQFRELNFEYLIRNNNRNISEIKNWDIINEKINIIKCLEKDKEELRNTIIELQYKLIELQKEILK